MENKIKICHICNLGLNGKAVFLCNILENTNFNKYDITIINYRAEHADPILNRLAKLPITIVPPHYNGIKSFCRFLNNHFKHNHYDICHSHIWDLSGIFLGIAKYHNIPCRVIHSHNTSKAQGRYGLFKGIIRDKILWNIMRGLIKVSANNYMACSEDAAMWLFPKSIIRKQNYHVIPNGINLAQFECQNRNKHNPTEILFAGRLIYQKNPLFALKAFKEYLKLNPTAHMTMVGSGKMSKEVDEAINSLKLNSYVHRVPETSDMSVFYKNADLYLFPSNYEGLGITLIEAQASGLKCLASTAVPLESQCGLVEYKPLSDGHVKWGTYIEEIIETNKEVSFQSLKKFDIKASTKQMYSLYQYK